MVFSEIDKEKIIEETKNLLNELFPICRSITGDGVRKSLSILKSIIDFEIKGIPSKTQCYDWTVPNEWNINDAYVKNSAGQKIIDFKKNNLHVVGYSIPINRTMSFSELDEHLHTLPKLSDAIPYRTSYYKQDWGFCLSQIEYEQMNKNDTYQVLIDSSLYPGKLNYGESIVKGISDHEFLFSTYCCHPSMANDNLSGLVLWALLLRILKNKKTIHSYRFIAVPETIGSISYLHKHQNEMKKILGGFILTCTGGPENFSYKQTYLENHLIDKTVQDTFKELTIDPIIYPFDIRGSDERQYSSPFFRIPIGTICKGKYHEYDYYHTSKDDLAFVDPENIVKTLFVYLKIIDNLEKTKSFSKNNANQNNMYHNSNSTIFKSLHPYCEPMLSKRGLYPTLGGSIRQKISSTKSSSDIENDIFDAISWILFYSDGYTSINDISKKTKIPESVLNEAGKKLVNAKLLEKVTIGDSL